MAAKRLAAASPIPLAAPVTTATRPGASAGWFAIELRSKSWRTRVSEHALDDVVVHADLVRYAAENQQICNTQAARQNLEGTKAPWTAAQMGILASTRTAQLYDGMSPDEVEGIRV
jgi:hypothetical protein